VDYKYLLDKCLTGKVIKDQRIALVLKGTCWEGAVKRANLVIEIPETAMNNINDTREHINGIGE